MLSTTLLANYRDPLEVVTGIGLIDVLVIPFYLLIIYLIAFAVKNRYYKGERMGKYLIWGLTAKIAGGLAFAAIYVYYYESRGDTFFYFDGAKAIWQAFNDSFILGIKTLWSTPGVFTEDTFKYTSQIPSFWKGDTEQVFMSKILGVILVLSFKTYWLATILMATFSFSGVWKLYTVFRDLYPELEKQLAFAILFIPSALFWGSGILKDTVCMAALGWLVYGLYNVFISRKKVLISLIIVLFTGRMIMELKAYIFLGFLPALLTWIYMRHKSNHHILLIKYTLTPMFLAVLVVGGYFLLNVLTTEFKRYSLENLEATAKGFHDFHGRLSTEFGQTGYNLGTIEYTPAGVLKKLPAAVNVAYFRPYLWEVSDPFQALSAIESMTMFFFFLFVFFRAGPMRFLRAVFSNPEVAMCMTYAIIFGFAVGFTAYNFGALVRFKIPGVPFLASGLLIVYHLQQQRKASQATLLEVVANSTAPKSIQPA